MRKEKMRKAGQHKALSKGILRKHAGLVLMVLSLLVLAACSTTAPKKNDDIADRAQLRWDTLLERDYDTAYSLYAPGYRSANSRVDFEIETRLRRVNWISAEYLEHECSNDRCVVKFKVGYRVNKPVPGLDSFESSSVVSDTWVKTGGEWWYVPPIERD